MVLPTIAAASNITEATAPTELLTNPQTSAKGNAVVAMDSFSLVQTSGAATLASVSVEVVDPDASGLASADIASVSLRQESGATPGFQEAQDTLVAGASVSNPTIGSPVTLTPTSPVAIGATPVQFYIVITLAASPTNGHHLTINFPTGYGTDNSANTVGTPLTGTKVLAIDMTSPTISKVEKINPQAVNVTFSEPVSDTAATTTSYTFSDNLSVTGVSRQNSSIYTVYANNNITTGSTTLTVSSAVLDLAGNANASTSPVTIVEPNKVKISEVMYGTNTDTTNEFVELYNGSPAPADVSAYKLHIRNASGTDTNVPLTFATSSIPAFGFFLIAPDGANVGATPDATYSTSTAELVANGGVYISKSASAGVDVIDKLGWGTQPPGGFEGSPASAFGLGSSLERKAFGDATSTDMMSGGKYETQGNSWDSDSNSFDFVLRSSPQPQNSLSPAESNMGGGGGGGGGGNGPMINHMPVNLASTGSNLAIMAQMGDPQTPVNQLTPELHYMIGDGTPGDNTPSQYTAAVGTYEGNGFFQFVIPQATVDGSLANGVYYYLKLTSSSGTKLMSNNPTADSSGLEANVAQNPFKITIQNGSGWTKHNITGTLQDQAASPIAGAFVFLEGTGYATTTAADGTFSLTGVKDGIYNLIMAKDGYYQGNFNNISLNGSNFDVGIYPLSAGSGGGMTGDSTQPTVKWTGPNDGMTGIPPGVDNFQIFIGFSKDLDGSTFNNTNVYLTTDGSTPVASTVVYDNNPAGRAANTPPDPYLGIVNPPSGGFAANTTYYLVMTGNVRDTAGNPLQGNRAQGGHVISFTTGSNFMGGGGMGTSSSGFTYGSGDMRPPFVLGTIPFDGTMDVVPNTKINIGFSDPMDQSSIMTAGNLKLYKVDIVNNAESLTPITISASVDTSQKIAILTPSSNLAAGKYRIVVTGALKSATGIFMGDPATGQNTSSSESFRSNFEVGANTLPDTTKPTVVGTWPVNNDTSIAVNPGVLTIQFSEGMDPSTVNADTITLTRGTTQVTGSVSYDPLSRSASFIPNVALSPSTSYALTITGSATATSTSVTDIVGNPLAANDVVNFTTTSAADTQAPQIMFANGDDFAVAVTFNEPMNSAKITDSTNWPHSVLNPANYILKYGDPGTATSTWTSINIATSTLLYDGTSNTATIKDLGLPPGTTSGKNYYVDMSSSGAADLSGNLVASSTASTSQMPAQSSAQTNGMLGPNMGGGMTGGQMGPSMNQMGMMKAGVSPMNAMAGQTTTYFVDMPVTKAIANGDKIVLTFPQGFDVTSAMQDANSPMNSDINANGSGTISFSTVYEESGGAAGDGVTVDAAAHTITVTLTVSGTTPASDFLHFDLAGIKNSSIPRDFNTSGYSVDMKVLDASDNLQETVTPMPFFINQGGTSALSGSVTLTGATENGTVNVYLGSPMTGPLNTSVTITNGTGSYSFSNIPDGSYMIFTDPTLTLTGTSTQWNGMNMPMPVTVSGNTTKNLTFASQNSGSVLDLTVNLSGAFGSNSIDVFAGNPSGFRVTTITNPGTNPAAVHLYLPAGDWMIGVGPSMPKGPMSGPPPMPDWMPPMPQMVKSTGSGSSSITLSIASANMNIIGYVTDGVATTSYPNGTPIANAEVYAYQPMGNGMGSHTTTDTSGKFTLKIAQPGNYSVGTFKPGLPSVPDRSVVVNNNSSNTDGNSSADIYVDNNLITASNLFVLKIKKPAHTISGKLTDGTNPVSYAPVWAYQANGYGNSNTMTDSSGNYILYVDNGTWVVNANIPNYGDAQSQTVVVNGSDMTQNLAPANASTYYTISGSITIGGTAQANMPIRAVEYSSAGAPTGKEYHGFTDSSGAYSISVPGTGTSGQYKYYRVDIWTPDYGQVGLSYDQIANNPANIRIDNTGTTTADILINPSNLITATVSLANKSGYSGKEGILTINGVTCSGSTCKPSDFHKILRIPDISGADQTIQLKSSSDYFFSLDIPGVDQYMPDLDPSTGRDSTTGSVIATTTDRVVNFTLPNTSTAMAAITGTVTDVSSNPVTNAWVWIKDADTGYFNGTSTIADGSYSLSVPIGTNYKVGAEKPGYMSVEPADLSVSAATSKNLTLTKGDYKISGHIYADANSNSSYDAGEEVANGWVRAETTDGTQKTNAPTDGNGYFELPVVNGTWEVYGSADGYEETQLASNVTVNGANQTNQNIKLTVDASWANKSQMTKVTPASGVTLDDTASSSTGIEIIAPPNALSQSTGAGSLTAAITNAVVTTNSSQPFAGEGTKITAKLTNTDNTTQALDNLQDYIDIEKNIYKSEIDAQITAGNVDLTKLKTMQNGYWDSTSNDWVSLPTTRAAYYKTNSNDTEWTLYSNPNASDDFNAFIDTLVAGTNYADYKLVFTSKTKHLTIFAIIMPFVATPAQAAPASPAPAPAVISGGGSLSTFCSEVTYSDWGACSDGYQHRSVTARTPNSCVLTTNQEAQEKRACQTTLPETINQTTQEITQVANNASATAKEFAEKIIAIASDAAEIIKANVNALLGKLGFERDLAKETSSAKKYVRALIKDTADLENKHVNAITNFVTYGSETTLKLGAGERAGVLGSYKDAFNKLPKTQEEWDDVIKIANGRWPGEKSDTALEQAKTEFVKVYKRTADMNDSHDNAAVTVIAYGLRPINRNLDSERAAIKIFKGVYGHNPISALAWDIVRAIAYSGAKR